MSEDKAITRGHPSYVWRFGQDRRLNLIHQFAPVETPRRGVSPQRGVSTFDGLCVLDIGCGIGTYVSKFEQHGARAFGVDVEYERLQQDAGAHGRASLQLAQAVSEQLPFPANTFDIALLHEVIEHVQDDRATIAEALRVVQPGGRVVIFAPNRGWPFETHGCFWRGQYHFGNIPLIPYLPEPLRNHLAPHVRTYTVSSIRKLVDGLPGKIIAHTQVYPGYDNVVARRPTLGKWLRQITYALEATPLRALGLSHLLVIEKLADFTRME